MPRCPLNGRYRWERWGNRPAPGCGYLKILGAALQADGETRSVVTASSIRRRSAAWTILLDWTYRSRRPASALWMTRAESCGFRADRGFCEVRFAPGCVAKVPKRCATIFPPKDEPSDDHRSLYPQARQRSCQ